MAKEKKATEEKKPVGPVIKAPPTLHGKRTKLVRGGKETPGVLLSQDGQASNDTLVFQWTDENGNSCISPVTGEELEKLLSSG